MKIARIAIKNFLGLDNLDIALERPLLLVSGPNATGKTSIVHALRFVLDNDLVRVEHKKDIKELIREGAKLGSVSVSVMNSDTDTGTVFEYTRSAATGHFTSPHPPPESHPALLYCLDPAAFTAMAPQERRGFLYKLMGVKCSATDIIAKLEGRKHPPAVVARIATHLRSGFPMAYTEAMGIGRELKGRWREVTGETYGEVKAKSWSVTAPAVDEAHIEQLKKDIAQYDEEIRALQTRHGALTERAAECQRLTKRMAETTRIAGECEARKGAVKDVRTQLDKLTAEEKNVRETLEKAKLAVTVEAHAAQGAFFECPSCKTPLVYSRGECKVCPETAYSVDAVKEAVAAEKLVKEIELVLKEVLNRKRIADRLLVDAINAVGQSQAAADALKDLNEPEVSDDAQDDAVGIKEVIAVKTAARFAARQALDRFDAAAHAHNEALAKTSRARAIHEELKAVITLAADLAPDGLPAELLARAMRPINERLRDSAVMAGWSSVSITTEEILVHGRHWNLASESERWRAMAMMAEAIAYLAGIKCFVLDRMDILDVPSRAQALAWLIEVAKEHESIIVMATLKAPPALPASIQSVWLGEVEPVGHVLSGRS